MGRKSTVITHLYCENCNLGMPIARKESLQKQDGHIKHMYCPTCKKVTGFVETKKDSVLDFWEEWHGEQSNKGSGEA